MLLRAIVVAGMTAGLNLAIAATDVDSGTSIHWSDFQRMMKRCEALTGDARTQCMDDARMAYRSLHYNCQSLSGADRTQCLKYSEEWKTASSYRSSTPAVRSDNDPTVTSPAGDPTASERNRDSTIQQEDATRTLPPEQKR